MRMVRALKSKAHPVLNVRACIRSLSRAQDPRGPVCGGHRGGSPSRGGASCDEGEGAPGVLGLAEQGAGKGGESRLRVVARREQGTTGPDEGGALAGAARAAAYEEEARARAPSCVAYAERDPTSRRLRTGQRGMSWRIPGMRRPGRRRPPSSPWDLGERAHRDLFGITARVLLEELDAQGHGTRIFKGVNRSPWATGSG